MPGWSRLENLFHQLTHAEQSRASEFTDSGSKARFVASHAMVRWLLVSYLPFPLDRSIAMRRSPGEKPKLRWPHSLSGLEFSLSTSHEQIVVAIARRPVGVDIQWIEELGDLQGSFEASSRASTWSRAEAVVKLRGTGLEEIERFDVDGRSPLAVVDEDGQSLDIIVTDLVVPEAYIGAIASRGPYELIQRAFEYHDI